MQNSRLRNRNIEIQAMMTDGERLKTFYRFVANNPHILKRNRENVRHAECRVQRCKKVDF